jgi:hypothetical protein
MEYREMAFIKNRSISAAIPQIALSIQRENFVYPTRHKIARCRESSKTVSAQEFQEVVCKKAENEEVIDVQEESELNKPDSADQLFTTKTNRFLLEFPFDKCRGGREADAGKLHLQTVQ